MTKSANYQVLPFFGLTRENESICQLHFLYYINSSTNYCLQA